MSFRNQRKDLTHRSCPTNGLRPTPSSLLPFHPISLSTWRSQTSLMRSIASLGEAKHHLPLGGKHHWRHLPPLPPMRRSAFHGAAISSRRHFIGGTCRPTASAAPSCHPERRAERPESKFCEGNRSKTEERSDEGILPGTKDKILPFPCAVAQFMAKPIHADRQFMPSGISLWSKRIVDPRVHKKFTNIL